MRDSKMLLKLLRLHLQGDPPGAPIVHIFLAADPAAPRAMQHGLFVPSSPDPEKLELTLARLANLVGPSRVGSPRIPDSHRPGAFEMSRFLPARDAPELHEKTMREKTGSLGERAALAAFRAFRPAPRAAVALRDGRPAHISFSDMHGEVMAASGPWRTSGEWWREDAWSREEWEIEIRPAADRHAAASGPSAMGLRLPASRRAEFTGSTTTRCAGAGSWRECTTDVYRTARALRFQLSRRRFHSRGTRRGLR